MFPQLPRFTDFAILLLRLMVALVFATRGYLHGWRRLRRDALKIVETSSICKTSVSLRPRLALLQILLYAQPNLGFVSTEQHAADYCQTSAVDRASRDNCPDRDAGESYAPACLLSAQEYSPLP